MDSGLAGRCWVLFVDGRRERTPFESGPVCEWLLDFLSVFAISPNLEVEEMLLQPVGSFSASVDVDWVRGAVDPLRSDLPPGKEASPTDESGTVQKFYTLSGQGPSLSNCHGQGVPECEG